MAMTFDVPRCTICGDLARGTLEWVPGVAILTCAENGEAQYEGATRMDWDGQSTCRDEEGRVTLECANGHRWKSRLANE